MACEVVDDGDGPSVFRVQPQDSDLRIDRPHLGDCFVGWQRVGVTTVDDFAAFQFQTAVFRNAIFMTGSDADRDRNHLFSGLLNSLESSTLDIRTNDSVAMA